MAKVIKKSENKVKNKVKSYMRYQTLLFTHKKTSN